MFIAFLITGIVLVLVIGLLICFPYFKKKYEKNNTIPAYGRSIYSFVNKEDYYLINNLLLDSNDETKLHIDHLLFGDKFIFVIKDCYQDGAVEYKTQDENWILYFGKKNTPQKKFISNPLLINEKRVSSFSMITSLDKSFLISVVIFNNDCIINDYCNETGDSFVIKRKDLPKLVKEIESRNVAPLDKDQLSYAVHDIARINLRP